MESLHNRDSIIARHADKGSWQISEESLTQIFPAKQAALVVEVLQNDFPEMIEAGETPLTLEGIQRSLKLAENLYDKLPAESILVTLDSGKDRAKLCRHLVTERLSQLEGKEKIIDMLEIDEKEIVSLLADSNPDTWAPYELMMKNDGLDEGEAIFRWLNDMNDPSIDVAPEKSPKESAERYRQLVKLIHGSITQAQDGNSHQRQSPVILFGVGHSGSLGQALYEDRGGITAEEVPHFCEQFQFNNDGKIVASEKVDLN
ncbi:MAG: hypothetical protein PHW95_00850 [Patescibacteria group bacterium]|nr:hypothetical protein [Patescibacteria group bacterium]